jgi:hypothetical protein
MLCTRLLGDAAESGQAARGHPDGISRGLRQPLLTAVVCPDASASRAWYRGGSEIMRAPVETEDTELFRKPCGSLHRSWSYGADLIVCDRGDVVGGVARSVRLSADGRSWSTVLHEGPEAEPVYVEEHGPDGAFHGWVDSVSRRIVYNGPARSTATRLTRWAEGQAPADTRHWDADATATDEGDLPALPPAA